MSSLMAPHFIYLLKQDLLLNTGCSDSSDLILASQLVLETPSCLPSVQIIGHTCQTLMQMLVPSYPRWNLLVILCLIFSKCGIHLCYKLSFLFSSTLF